MPEPTAAALMPGAAEQLLRRLEWTVIRKLDGLRQGDYRTLLRGAGLDLADLREYSPPDDVRHIDWNVTARLQVPHVRVFTEDREMDTWFALDLSPSMDFGSGERTKRALATDFVAVVARLLTRHGNRVGAFLDDGQGTHKGNPIGQWIPARGGRAHVLHLLHSVLHRPAHGGRGHTRLHELLHSVAGQVRRRSMVLVVSDFFTDTGWEKPLGQLAMRHDVVAVRLVDPLEQSLPDLGMIPVQDAETGEVLMVDTHDAGFRRRFAQLAAQREDTLRATLARAGVDTLELSTTDDLLDALTRFMDMRRRRVRAAGHGTSSPLQDKVAA
ncbi:MAG: DUF58 domain-containing protein [Xylophilus sp.]|nr:DUF58 domain-containing protein [Xylophilus sp.]